eukprot:TRINITY_DN11130_c0_g2_i1.p3 TRINITY_DN11130_c0_g2~~TRINITY_DN11130_c0_g2_i1.p3  ORF type:complete len:121 (-),score=23.11 TRINITY_DN11130_c0_g2_i1:186-548(-)
MAKSFYQQADGVVLVFDLTDKKSFDRLHIWAKSIREAASKDVIKFLVGNKLDLTEDRVVDHEEAMKVASEYDMKYYETSAKQKVNVVEVFEDMINEAYENGNYKSSKILERLKTTSKSCC